MNNDYDLYIELKELQKIVDERIDKKSQVMTRAEKSEGTIDSFKQWIFNWLK